MQTLFPAGTGNHACRFLCVGVACTHTLWQHSRPETPRSIFPTCSCLPPSKEKHKWKSCFTLGNVIPVWRLDVAATSAWIRKIKSGLFLLQTGHKYQPDKPAALQTTFWKLLADCIYDSLSLMTQLILPNLNKAMFYYWSFAWACANVAWPSAFGW